MTNRFKVNPEFRGINGARAYHAALTLIRSLWHIPFATPHSDFYQMTDWFDLLPDEEKRKYLKLAVHDGAMLEEHEIESLLGFALDQNEIPIGKETIKNLNPFEIHEAILDVACEIFKKKVFFYQTNK